MKQTKTNKTTKEQDVINNAHPALKLSGQENKRSDQQIQKNMGSLAPPHANLNTGGEKMQT